MRRARADEDWDGGPVQLGLGTGSTLPLPKRRDWSAGVLYLPDGAGGFGAVHVPRVVYRRRPGFLGHLPPVEQELPEVFDPES